MIREFEFDLRLIKRDGHVFPGSLEEAWKWVLYHGTSGCFEAEIEADGLRWIEGAISKDSVTEVIRLFEWLDWEGTGDGLFVLEAFTQPDFGELSHKPLFFRAVASRVLLYASQRRAGGETSYALRQCFRDLEALVADPEIAPSLTFDRDELKQRLAKLASVREACRLPATRHTHGVIYAVRFTADDLGRIENREGAGLVVTGPISPEQLVGKVVVPRDLSYVHHDVDQALRLLNLERDPTTLVGALRAKSG